MDAAEIDELTTGPFVAGGDTISRVAGQRVTFVEGALPEERVRVEITEERKDLRRGRVIEVVDASPDRITAPCPTFHRGCGGCQWQHVGPTAQHQAKVDIVRDALTRIAKIEVPSLRFGGSVPEFGYRTTLRMAVAPDGRLAYRRRHSNDLITTDVCPIGHPLLADVIEEGRFSGVNEVTLRASIATGERLVLVGKSATAHVPDDVIVATGNAAMHEDVCGQRFQVNARSFFQSGVAAAELIAETVDAAVPEDVEWIVDAYAGIGMLGAVVANRRHDVRVTAVEQSRSAVRDATENLRAFDSEVVEAEVATVSLAGSTAPDVVIADPARTGLGKSAAATLTALGPETFILVSCDPASFARDTVLITDAGYELTSVSVLDLFPQTHHVETVSVFRVTDV